MIPLRVLETAVEHGVDAEHHAVRQFVPILRVVVDTPLFLQFPVQFLNVQPCDPGDDLAAEIRLHIAPDVLLVAAQGVGS